MAPPYEVMTGYFEYILLFADIGSSLQLEE
jgi:hypothetical protein